MTFENYLKSLSFDRLVWLWNEYCWSDGSADEAIHDCIEALSDEGILTGIELARAVFFGDVRGWNDRVSFNGYGNLYSVYDYDSSPIVISYLAKWLKYEEHEVYDEWVEDVTGEFAEYLVDNVAMTELYELWVEYEFVGEPASDAEVEDMFDAEILAVDLLKDNHWLFQDWLQEDDESAELEERKDEI